MSDGSLRQAHYWTDGENPPPYGSDDQEAWRRWAESMTISGDWGARCSEIQPGRVVMHLDESPVRLNPIGSVHGGVIAAMTDQILGTVFITGCSPDVLPATASLSIDYWRPAFPPLTFVGRITSSGRTMVFCEVEVTDKDGKVCSISRGIMSVRKAVDRADDAS